MTASLIDLKERGSDRESSLTQQIDFSDFRPIDQSCFGGAWPSCAPSGVHGKELAGRGSRLVSGRNPTRLSGNAIADRLVVQAKLCLTVGASEGSKEFSEYQRPSFGTAFRQLLRF